MTLIDTNVFLEILLGQSKAEIAENVLVQLVNQQEPIVISSFTIHSIIVILERKKQTASIKPFLTNLARIENMTFYYPTFEEELEILDLKKDLKLDFDDAFQYYVAKKMNAQLVTFDRDFDKVRDISIRIL